MSEAMKAETRPTYHAHSVEGRDTSHWQLLSNHLLNTGAMAASFADVFGAAALAEVQGRLHDLGKYTVSFKRRLEGGPRVDHSTWGARIACERYGALGHLLAYGIAGHHAGLANGQDAGERTPLHRRLAAELPPLDAIWQREIDLPAGQLPPPVSFKPSKERAAFQLTFLTRMLFSCLVDADFLDTENFYDKAEGRVSRRGGKRPELAALRERLDAHLAGFQADTEVNRIRADILTSVRSSASEATGLFSLTVPTGGGKTLASLAFALDHAIHHGLRRVIFVIPFTSIVEQNAAVFRGALGDLGEQAVLEHHSAFIDEGRAAEARDKLRLAMENWDYPIVVTTAVQFFESLFSARPSQCRKLHRIAGSVVVLDEAQTMPLKLLRPCVAAIDELARNYRSSVVLCTATQPALNAPEFQGGLEGVKPLGPDPALLFRQLERVKVRHLGALSDDALTAQMRQRTQVLCIVNNRRHAQAVFQSMADLPGSFHLSTLMCAKHRSEVLATVRLALRAGSPCRLVSTSLIEAGVDVDFPTVLRAEAGLDAIAQAAGRCNREGRRAASASEVLIFCVDNDDWAPPPELVQFAEAAREVLRQHPGDALSPEAIERYFKLLYWKKGDDALDAHDLLGLTRNSRVESLPMETLATKFRMIDSVQMPVIVPYDDAARAALEELRNPFAQGCGRAARRLQPYLVQLPRQGFDALRAARAIAPVRPEKWGEQFMELVNLHIYDEQFGLRWDAPTFMDAAATVI